MHSTRFEAASHVSSFRDAAVARAVSALMAVVECDAPRGSPFARRESALLEVANELCRLGLTRELGEIAESFTDEVIVAGVRYRRHEPGTVAYHSLCGDVTVARHTYRRVDERNGPTVVPLELVAGLIEGATPSLARSVAEGIAELPSRRYEALLRAAHRAPPSRSTTERLAKALGNEIKREIPVIETIVRSEERLPDGAHAISVGLDRTTVPMAEERPPSTAPISRRDRRSGARVRSAPPPIDVVYRMAYVGTVTIVDRNGDALVTRKYAATAEEGSDELVERILADVRHLRAQRELPIVVVQDGAPELWGLMWDGLRTLGIPRREWNLVLDRFHVTERIGTVLSELVRDEEERARIFATWRARLDTSDRAVVEFVGWMDATTRDRPRLRSRVDGHRSYLHSYGSLGYTRYKTFKLRGFPTASGVTEGACKSLVTVRCKRSGQRWQQDGLTAILTLRAIVQSDRMDAVWPRFARRYQRRVDYAA